MTVAKLYIPDDPIDEIKDDRFHHDTYANILLEIIKEVDPPCNIGLFGRWGSGKTSIIRILMKKIDDKGVSGQKIAYFEFDAWKYAGDSIREQILLQLNHKFGTCKEQDIKDKLFCIIEKEIPVKNENGITKKIKEIWHQAPLFLSSLLIVFLISAVLMLFKVNVSNIIVPLLLIPLFLEFISKIDSTTISMGRKQTLPTRESPAQFEEIFTGIIDSIEADRVVIIIDNLDRCPGKIAIEMLSMIKTFMDNKKCIYISPCDDEALRKHLNQANGKEYSTEDAPEFLRKFFQTSIKIPPFIDEDIEIFTKNLNSELKYPFGEGVIDVIKSAYTKNPRRMKHALNKLTTLKLLAHKIENGGVICKGTITRNIEFLAKISIIEEEWPTFYQELLDDGNLLDDIESYIREYPRKHNTIDELFEKNKGLEHFLNANRLITAEDTSPFLMLNQTSYEVALPDATIVRNCLQNNDSKCIRRILEEATSDVEKTDYIKIIIKTLNDAYKTKRYQVQFNCLDILTEIYEQIPQQIGTEVFSTFATNIDTSKIMENLYEFNPQNLFKVIGDLDNKDYVLLNYVDLIVRDGKIDANILSQFIQNYLIVPAEVMNKLSRTIIVRLSATANGLDDNGDNQIALAIIEPIINSDAKTKLLNQKVVESLINRIGREENSQEQKELSRYLKIKDIADTTNQEYFIKKQLSLVGQTYESNAQAINDSIIANLSNLNDGDVPTSIMDEMYNEIIKIANPFIIDQRTTYYSLIIKHFNKLSESTKDNFRNNHLNPLFSSGNANTITQILNIATQHDVSILEYENFFNTLKQRIIDNLKDQNIVISLIKITPQNKLDELSDFIIQLIAHDDVTLSQIGANSFTQTYNFFQNKQMNAICSELLNVASKCPIESKNLFVNPVATAFEKCSIDTKRRFVDHMLKLLIHDDVKWWGEGKRIYDIITLHLTSELKNRIVSQTINKLNKTQDSHLPNVKSLCDVIISLEEAAQKEDWIVFLDGLSKMISDAQQSEIRVIGLQCLEKINKLYQRLDGILDQILQAATSSDTQVAEQAKNTLISFKGRSEGHETFWEKTTEVLPEI